MALAGALVVSLVPGVGRAATKTYVGNSLDGEWLACWPFHNPQGGGACFEDIPGTAEKASVTIQDENFAYVAGVYEVWGTYSTWPAGYTNYNARLYTGAFCGYYPDIDVTTQVYYDEANNRRHQYDPEEIKVLVGGPRWAVQFCGAYLGAAGPGTKGTITVSFS